METIVYTCITNDYDELIEINSSFRCICFTDKDRASSTWEIVKIKAFSKIHRKIKICPHLFLPPHERNIWIDGSLRSDSFDRLIGDKNGFWAVKHPDRNCIYSEGIHCIDYKKDSEEVIMKQLNKYYFDGYPPRNGLIASGFLIRENNFENIQMAKMWWNEVRMHSIRDQISFNYVAWKLGLKINLLQYEKGYNVSKHL